MLFRSSTGPVSSVQVLPTADNSPNFTVQWQGSDVGSGIQNFTIYVSRDGGGFAPWLINTTIPQSIREEGNIQVAEEDIRLSLVDDDCVPVNTTARVNLASFAGKRTIGYGTVPSRYVLPVVE